MMEIKHIIVILLGLCLCSCYSKGSAAGKHHKKNSIGGSRGKQKSLIAKKQELGEPQGENEGLGGDPLGRLDPSQGVGGLGGDMDGVATGMGAGAEPLGISKTKEVEAEGMDESGGALQGLGEENEHLRGGHENLNRPFSDDISREGQDYIEGHGHTVAPNMFPGVGNLMGTPSDDHTNAVTPNMFPSGNFLGTPNADRVINSDAFPPSDVPNFNSFSVPHERHGDVSEEERRFPPNNILNTAEMESQMTSPGESELSAALRNNNMLDKVNIQGDRDVGELVRNAAKTKQIGKMNLEDLTKMNEASIVEPDFNMPKPPMLFNERDYSLHGERRSKAVGTKRRLQKLGNKGKKFKKFKKLQ